MSFAMIVTSRTNTAMLVSTVLLLLMLCHQFDLTSARKSRNSKKKNKGCGIDENGNSVNCQYFLPPGAIPNHSCLSETTFKVYNCGKETYVCEEWVNVFDENLPIPEPENGEQFIDWNTSGGGPLNGGLCNVHLQRSDIGTLKCDSSNLILDSYYFVTAKGADEMPIAYDVQEDEYEVFCDYTSFSSVDDVLTCPDDYEVEANSECKYSFPEYAVFDKGLATQLILIDYNEDHIFFNLIENGGSGKTFTLEYEVQAS